MKELEERILKDGVAIGDDILKVDSFLNQQIDTALLDNMGKEIAKIFADEKPTKVLTVEASGIAIAAAAAFHMGKLPLVFAKKSKPSTMVDDFYTAESFSFTKGTKSNLYVSKKYIGSGERVLIVDDFLAMGNSGLALCDIVKQAGATVVGYTAAVEKQYQGGADKIRELGVKVQSLAVIKEMHDGKITFEED